VWELLDDWEPLDYEREDEYTEDLALEAKSLNYIQVIPFELDDENIEEDGDEGEDEDEEDEEDDEEG
jgi:hypothetical protein